MDMLILLIGENPLPNYIVSSYVLNKERKDKDILPIPNKIVLLHSNHTQEIANILRDKLNKKNYISKENIVLKNLLEKEREEKYIYKKIEEIIEETERNNQINTIHLNYTGGTKPMAIYSYNTIKKLKDKEILLSDIDPKSHKLKIDFKEIFLPREGDLRDFIKLNIKDLFELHGMNLYEYKEVENKKILKIEEIEKDGNKFEDYIFLQLKNLKDEVEFDYIYKNIKAKKEGRLCEIDVIVIKGYQLYLFTCTITSELKEVKLKAFEGIYRAQQLGGTHSKTIITTLLKRDKIDELKLDLSGFNIKGKYEIIGLDDLKDNERLKSKLIGIFT